MDLSTASLPVALTPLGSAVGRPVLVLPGGPCRPPEYLTDFAGLGERHPLVVLHPRARARRVADDVDRVDPERVDRCDDVLGVRPPSSGEAAGCGRAVSLAYAGALGAELAMISGCGHYPWVEKPEEFHRILDAWLSARG